MNGRLLLASDNEFGFDFNITNVALDTAISSTLVIQVPEQVRLSETVSELVEIL